MFEREAEEYRKDLKSKFFLSESQLDLACQGFKDGAGLGYNKANEWHYVGDGDLPPRTTLVLIAVCRCFILGWLDDNDVWHNDNNNGVSMPRNTIYAWKEIIPPKEVSE